MNSHFNTTALPRPERRAAELHARGQEDAIQAWYAAHPAEIRTPSEVWQAVLPGALLTSVRRAMTNLTDRGVLERTSTQRRGPYGRREYCWRWRGDKQAQGRLW